MNQPNNTNKKSPPRRVSWKTGITKIGGGVFGLGVLIVLGIIFDVANFFKAEKTGGQTVTKSQNVQQNHQSPNSIQINTTTSGGVTNVFPLSAGKVDGATSFFESSFEKTTDWTFSEGISTEGRKISDKGLGRPALHLTKQYFTQDNTYTISFVPISKNPDLVFRVENSFDIRFGDGGQWEVALYSYAREGNWPPSPLVNSNTGRPNRWKLPCAIIKGNAIEATISVAAIGEFRKSVTLTYEYQCESGRFITPQDSDSSIASWTFTVPEFTNTPARFGIGFSDPKGKDSAQAEILSVTVQNE